MEGVPLLAFVFLTGLTVCGFCGTVFESVTGQRLLLREPFVSASNLSRSLVLVLLAGPFMVANEALAALSERRVGTLLFIGVAVFCLLWLFATGIFVLGLVEGARDSLG